MLLEAMINPMGRHSYYTYIQTVATNGRPGIKFAVVGGQLDISLQRSVADTRAAVNRIKRHVLAQFQALKERGPTMFEADSQRQSGALSHQHFRWAACQGTRPPSPGFLVNPNILL